MQSIKSHLPAPPQLQEMVPGAGEGRCFLQEMQGWGVQGCECSERAPRWLGSSAAGSGLAVPQCDSVSPGCRVCVCAECVATACC